MTPADRLLAELAQQTRNRDPRFLQAVRPIAERILQPGLSEAQRRPLLEALAATFERDRRIRAATAASEHGLARLVAALLRRLGPA